MYDHLFLDKERYATELQNLVGDKSLSRKPKKPLTPYMFFVREVSI